MRSGGTFDIDRKRVRRDEIEKLSGDPAFWNDPQRAQSLLKEKSQLDGELKRFDDTLAACEDLGAHVELAEEANDDAERAAAAAAAVEVQRGVEALEFARMLGGPQDRSNAIVDINAGAGGTEAQDWAAMLFRMYTRYCERRGWKIEMADEQPGEESTGWCASRPSTPTRAATPRSPRSSSGPRWRTTSRWRSTRPTCASTPTAPRARAGRR
jgi:peptide chain release factor 2